MKAERGACPPCFPQRKHFLPSWRISAFASAFEGIAWAPKRDANCTHARRVNLHQFPWVCQAKTAWEGGGPGGS